MSKGDETVEHGQEIPTVEQGGMPTGGGSYSVTSPGLNFHADGRQRVFRRRNQLFNDPYVRQGDRSGGGSVMVWGAIRFGWRSNLVIVNGTLTSQRYVNEILSTEVVPYIQNHANSIFMQDNARPHVTRASLAYLQANNVSLLDWPAYSPDMNPIEHLWDHLDRQVRARTPPPRNLQELRQALTNE